MKLKNFKNSTLYLALRSTHLFHTLYIFLLVYFSIAFLIYRFDPAFSTYGETLWYCFELVSTVGFGEVVAVSPFGKVMSVILSMYSIAIIAIVTSTLVNYYQLGIRRQEDAEMILIMKKLEHLPELSKEELEALSEQFREWHS